MTSPEPLVPFDLSPQWKAVMEVYDIFADLANRHGLRFYLAFGSVLGAIRHGGFIPWDDDFDVQMPRKDYEEFRQLAARELPSHLKWVDWENTPEYIQLFGKVQDTRPEVLRQVERETDCAFPQGIYIDVFPLDGVPNTCFGKFRRTVQRQILRMQEIYRFVDHPKRWQGKIARLGGAVLARLGWRIRDRRDIQRIVDSRVREVSMEQSKRCGVPHPEWIDTAAVKPVEIFGEPRLVPFMGRMVPVPHDAERYLRLNYGDYLTLPPKEERRKPKHANQPPAPWIFGPTGQALSQT